jgi:ferredoxin
MSNDEQRRVLTIRGKAYCNSDCAFCIEKYGLAHPTAPAVDATRELVERGAGRYDMLFFANGEPSVSPRLFEHAALARSLGYRDLGMSSNFRAFADTDLAERCLAAGFRYFDVSLHASTRAEQLAVNPIGDEGLSLDEALLGLRRLFAIAERAGVRVHVTHKITICRPNLGSLARVALRTYKLGVRSYVIQPVKTDDLEPEVAASLAVEDAEIVEPVNEVLRLFESTGARFKLYGMRRDGLRASRALEEEQHLVTNLFGRQRKAGLVAYPPRARPVAREELPPRPDLPPGVHHVVVLRGDAPVVAFPCREDEIVLDAALAQGVLVSYGCRMASCAMCTARLLEGEVAAADMPALPPGARDEGYVLLCRSRPRSDLVVDANREKDLAR